MIAVYILVAFLVLTFMIAVHESGHYLAAKALKFKVEEFSIGLGKAIYKKKRKNGEIFAIRLIPLGGFCMFAGDDDLDRKLTGEKTNSFDPENQDKDYIPFNKQPAWKRLIVLAAGGIANLICAVVFAVIFLMVFGYHHNVRVTELDPNVANNQFVQNDVITHIDGNPFTFTKSFGAQMEKYNKVGDTFEVTVQREVNGVMTPVKFDVTLNRAASSSGRYSDYGGIGDLKQEWVSMSFGAALGKTWQFTGELIWFMLQFLGKLITGQISLFDIGGPFTTVSIMSEVMANQGLYYFLLFIPLISVNLGVFNLLPVPALDGGRMVFVGIEWARGKPVNPNIEGRVHMIGLFVILGLILFLDISYLFFR